MQVFLFLLRALLSRLWHETPRSPTALCGDSWLAAERLWNRFCVTMKKWLIGTQGFFSSILNIDQQRMWLYIEVNIWVFIPAVVLLVTDLKLGAMTQVLPEQAGMKRQNRETGLNDASGKKTQNRTNNNQNKNNNNSNFIDPLFGIFLC